MSRTATRIGGVFGLATAVVIIPAYLVGASSFLTANGTLPLLHLLFGLVFLGVLVSVLRSEAGPSGAVYIALIGGDRTVQRPDRHFGSATLIFATAFIVWRTGVLPRWTALLAVLGILPLLVLPANTGTAE